MDNRAGGNRETTVFRVYCCTLRLYKEGSSSSSSLIFLFPLLFLFLSLFFLFVFLFFFFLLLLLFLLFFLLTLQLYLVFGRLHQIIPSSPVFNELGPVS